MENKDRYTENMASLTEGEDGVAKMTLFVHDVYEAQIERLQENAKKWRQFCLALLAAIILTNVGWFIYELQFDSIVITQDANADGGDASVSGNVGDVYYGASQSDNPGSEETE